MECGGIFPEVSAHPHTILHHVVRCPHIPALTSAVVKSFMDRVRETSRVWQCTRGMTQSTWPPNPHSGRRDVGMMIARREDRKTGR